MKKIAIIISIMFLVLCLIYLSGKQIPSKLPIYSIATDMTITGLHNFIDSGEGGLTDYDIAIGDVSTPDYGLVQTGNSVIGRTSYNAGNLDLDGSFIFRNIGGPITGQIEFVWTESSGPSVIRFALPQSGVGNATYNPRSMLIAGPAVNNSNVVTVGYWQTNNSIFDNLLCDTSGSGADLGIQNDLEVEGDIFTDSIKESTAGAGISFDSFISMLERSADPAEPTEGNMVIWMSDGTGKGDDGDILMASKVGGVTRWVTIFDHSAGALW